MPLGGLGGGGKSPGLGRRAGGGTLVGVMPGLPASVARGSFSGEGLDPWCGGGRGGVSVPKGRFDFTTDYVGVSQFLTQISLLQNASFSEEVYPISFDVFHRVGFESADKSFQYLVG